MNCGDTSAENYVFLTKPTTLTSNAQCSFKICPCSNNICRIRYDFMVSNYRGHEISHFHVDPFSINVPGKKLQALNFTKVNWSLYGHTENASHIRNKLAFWLPSVNLKKNLDFFPILLDHNYFEITGLHVGRSGGRDNHSSSSWGSQQRWGNRRLPHRHLFDFKSRS